MIINILLLILTLLEFSKLYLTPEIHEIIGITLILLLIIHLIQNKTYIKTITQARTQKLLLITNTLLLITFTSTIITGLLSSQTMTILNIHIITSNYLHKILAHFTLTLISIHLGLNIKFILNRIKEKISNKHVQQIIAAIILLLGIISFIQVDYINHLTGNIGFSANNTNILINILQYLSIILSTAIITYYITSDK